MRYILRASRCIEPMTWLRFWRQLRNPLRWNLHIRPPSPGSSEPILFIDSGRVGYALWGTIVWPLDVSHMNYRELPFYVARTCLTFKTPPAASSTQASHRYFFSGSTKFNPPLFVLEFYGACARNIEWQMPELSINRYYYIVYTQHSPYWTSDLPTFRPNAVSDPCQLFIFVLFEG